MPDLAAAERGAASVRQARIARVVEAMDMELHRQASSLNSVGPRMDGFLVLDGEFDLHALAEAVDKVI